MRALVGRSGPGRRARGHYPRRADGRLAARIASAAFVVGGLLAYFVDALTWRTPGGEAHVLIAGTAVVLGGVGLILPWPRWPARAQLAIPVWGLLLILGAAAGRHADASPFLAVIPLLFVFIGFTQQPGFALAFGPPTVVGLLVAHERAFSQPVIASVLFVVPVSVLVAEAIAQSQQQRDRAHDQIAGLLQAVRVLARVSDERTGAQIVASLCARLLGADAVAVMVADRRRPGRFLNRAWFGHPALADAAPLVVDTRRDASLSARTTRFLPDAAVSPVLKASGASRGIRSAALLSLPGEGTRAIGIVVAMWGSPRRTLPTAARQSAELLTEEAGRMFQRLQATAALTRDAQTDPLTELANRRTFAHALATLQPSDAVVIVDLDHFKGVNDTYGHEAGDNVLRALARSLRGATRQLDTVARYGGEEFALVLPEAGGPGALKMLRRARQAWAKIDPLTTFSAGVAVHEAGEDATETIRRADAALYEAKDAGRDCDVLAPVREIVLG